MIGTELTSYVGGEWRTGSASLDDLNPAHPDEVVATVSGSGSGAGGGGRQSGRGSISELASYAASRARRDSSPRR